VQFDWDDANVSHVARHGVSRIEAEEALRDGFGQILNSFVEDDEERYEQIGATLNGRLLIVWFTMRDEAYRPITAFDAPNSAARRYRHGGN